jgi:hypothetical protein
MRFVTRHSSDLVAGAPSGQLGRTLSHRVLREQALLVLEQVAAPLADVARRPRPRPGDDHQRPIAPLDDPPLIERERSISDRRGNHEVSPE